MVSKNEILYAPLIDKQCRIVTQNKIFEGWIIFESKEILHIVINFDTKVKKILKSSIKNFYILNSNTEEFVEINPQLIQTTLISRLKKMK